MSKIERYVMSNTNTTHDTVTLRPHHLLCLRNFVGKGYSAGFTANMAAIHKRLMSDGTTAVKLTRGADDICAACPRDHGGVCESEALVCELDGNVAAVLAGVTTGTYAELDAAVGDMTCAGCEWKCG